LFFFKEILKRIRQGLYARKELHRDAYVKFYYSLIFFYSAENTRSERDALAAFGIRSFGIPHEQWQQKRGAELQNLLTKT
jgi:hypothetical protein